MSVTDFKPGSVILAGGSSCLDSSFFDPVIKTILSSFNVRSYRAFIISTEWNKEGDVPNSSLWLFDNQPERLCEDMVFVCKETVEKEGVDFIVIDRRNLSQSIEAYTDSDVVKLHGLAKEMNLMILFIPNLKDKGLNRALFTETFRCQIGLDHGNNSFDELCEDGSIDREKFNKIMAKHSNHLKTKPTMEEKRKTFSDLTEEERHEMSKNCRNKYLKTGCDSD